MHEARIRTPGLRRFTPLFFTGFLFALFTALSSFYNASLLANRGASAEQIGVVYLTASLVAIVLFFALPAALERFGNRVLTICAGCSMALSVFALIFTRDPFISTLLLALFLALQMNTYSLLDIFLERTVGTNEAVTGRVRGLFLAIANSAFIVAPFFAGLLIARGSFELLYICVTGAIVAFTTAVFFSSRHFTDPKYPHVHFVTLWHALTQSSFLRNALSIQLLLRFLYAVTMVYMIVYFHSVLGLSLSLIGAIVSIGLIPFLLVQLPLGLLGDRKLPQRQLLCAGFFIVGITTITFVLVPPHAPILLALVYFISNIGAAIIEVLSEIYFFTHVRGNNDVEIAAFRILTPFSYLLAPLCGTLILMFAPLSTIFFFLGFLMFIGIPLAYRIR
ncbi:MAG: MFS transporter [Patescibacteria group bacterium]